MAVDLIGATALGTKRYDNYNNNKKSMKHLRPGSPLALYTEARYLIIRLPNSQFLKLCYRLLLLALAVSYFPWMIRSSLIGIGNYSCTQTQPWPNSVDSSMIRLLSVFFRDLTNEGLMKKTHHKAVFLTNGNNNNEGEVLSEIVSDYKMELVPLNDLEKQNSLLDDTIDFVFTSNFPASSKFIDRTLKTGGVVAVVLNDYPSAAFYKPSNYRAAYMRRFNLTAVAMKKITGPNINVDELSKTTKFAAPRKLFGYASEAKKAALQNLEDVLLEPPRAASMKSRKYLKRTRYLPDLMGDSLESYSRRVFIDVGLPEKEGGSGTDWFPKNYPTRNKNFEIYKIETVTEGSLVTQIGMSDWLRKNVKEEEYVVMKAEAEVVEEMMSGKAIGLVDELFLECKPQHGLKKGNRSRRAYWECLALYGRLRDEGVAVHQWWG